MACLHVNHNHIHSARLAKCNGYALKLTRIVYRKPQSNNNYYYDYNSVCLFIFFFSISFILFPSHIHFQCVRVWVFQLNWYCCILYSIFSEFAVHRTIMFISLLSAFSSTHAHIVCWFYLYIYKFFVFISSNFNSYQQLASSGFLLFLFYTYMRYHRISYAYPKGTKTIKRLQQQRQTTHRKKVRW